MNLTGNDLALAQQATQMAIAWWREQSRPPSELATREIEKLDALNTKLGGILDGAEAWTESDDGEGSVMVIDPAVTEFNVLRAAGAL